MRSDGRICSDLNVYHDLVQHYEMKQKLSHINRRSQPFSYYVHLSRSVTSNRRLQLLTDR